MVKQKVLPYSMPKLEQEWRSLRKSTPEDFEKSPQTGVSLEVLERIGKALTTIPEGFNVLKQIDKLIKDRKEMIFESRKVNWAAAELLAYGSIVSEGYIVRLSGQDVQRGTFSHRHAVLHDAETNEAYSNLAHIEDSQGRFMIYNSLLSEYGVLGFEFGYSMANPNALVIWEAQFGDFANGAQVVIDQFIAGGETKWNRASGLVMLLPHGYEGQGAEHSSARIERYLQLCASENMVVVCPSTPAQMFHLLRRQMLQSFRKPLVVFTPKSLLRHPVCSSTVAECCADTFKTFIVAAEGIATARQILFCSGKIYFELEQERVRLEKSDTVIVRIEQLYPLDRTALKDIIDSSDKECRLCWVQEEPENMGAWQYIERHFANLSASVVYIGRAADSCPAAGSHHIHAEQQAALLKSAFSIYGTEALID